MDTREVDDQIPLPLPGFRFHPTDEELVSFYLRGKVEKRPIRLELIKQMDIYKHNPWDLPCNGSSNVGDKEWYFYCKRGRKYKNSIRPNRVTGSGFWKATGIDKPVGGEGNDHECIIGLKKTLVYYRGTAGKGTKTDWMMHEFRLPPNPNPNPNPTSKNYAEEAEIWTLCRIFKRNVTCRRYGTTTTSNTNPPPAHHKNTAEISYINFSSTESIITQNDDDNKPTLLPNTITNHHINYYNYYSSNSSSSSSSSMAPSSSVSSTPNPIASLPNNQQLDVNDFFTNTNWDELRSMVDMF